MAGSAGGAGTRDAAEQLRRSIAIFEEIGNEVELARSCRAYSELLRGMPEYSTDPSVVAQAGALAERAEEILAKMRAQAAARDELGPEGDGEAYAPTQV